MPPVSFRKKGEHVDMNWTQYFLESHNLREQLVTGEIENVTKGYKRYQKGH